MTAQSVVDYSFDHPTPQQIIDAGYVGVVRYLAPLPNPKVITRSEVERLHAAGLSVSFVFEWYNQRAAQTGYAGGQVDARIAVKQAQDLGAPPGTCIYYVLEDPTRIPVSQWPVVGGYLQGVGDVHRETEFTIGGYGSQDLVESCIYAGTVLNGWQVGGWSHSVSPHCHLYQRTGLVLGGSSDENACLQDDWGQWPRVAPPPPPHGDDMPLDEADILKVTAACENAIRVMEGVNLNATPEQLASIRDLHAVAAAETAIRVMFNQPPYATPEQLVDALATAVAAKITTGGVASNGQLEGQAQVTIDLHPPKT